MKRMNFNEKDSSRDENINRRFKLDIQILPLILFNEKERLINQKG